MMENILSKNELLAYVGDYSQVMGIKEYTFNSGKARGVRAFDIKNGKGLELTVLADRCMDIPYLSYKGINIGFVSKTGICAPEFYVEDEFRGFLKNFNAGFLTTGGLTYMGSACEDEGRKLGLHGPISNTPAENTSTSMKWIEDTAHIVVSGMMREACVFDEYIVLEREIRINSANNKLIICDKIENRGQKTETLMLLYHLNFGYPMLNANTKVDTDMDVIFPRDDVAEKGMDNSNNFEPPVVGYEEQVFFHTMSDKSLNETTTLVSNPELGLTVSIKYDPTQLPWLNHWKCPRAGDYALGIEPGNCHVGGRDRARKEGILKYIKPGEIQEFIIEIEILEK